MKAPAECETWTYWWIVKWTGPQPLASIWVWSWDPLRFVRRHPPHHLSPAEQTTRQGVILCGASATPQPAQQRSDQGRKPVISEQIVAGRAKILEARCRCLSQDLNEEHMQKHLEEEVSKTAAVVSDWKNSIAKIETQFNVARL